MKLDGVSAIVTGGASGLGAATASALAKAGARVVIADLQDGAAVAGGFGGVAVRGDVAEPEFAASAVAAATALAPLGVLVNCAGVGTAGRILGRDGPIALDTYARVVRVNLIGTFNMLRVAAAAMEGNTPLGTDNERGVIISTASIAAYDGQVGQAAYASSKAGIVGLTLPAARELARFGIRVVTIAPGLFETPMMRALPPEVQASLGASVPFPPRLGLPEEYAGLAMHIIANTMLNGEVIRLDGALRMAPR